MTSGLLVLQLLLCSFSTSISNAPTGFPTNIVVQAELRQTVARLWESSPTFRAQCERIGAQKRYRVAVVIDPSLAISRTWRAQCVLRAYSSGFVTARVMVPLTRQLTELIPHELEHVIEHIEGINVSREARLPGRGAYDVGAGRVETVRAMRVGRQAHEEIEASRNAVTVLTRR